MKADLKFQSHDRRFSTTRFPIHSNWLFNISGSKYTVVELKDVICSLLFSDAKKEIIDGGAVEVELFEDVHVIFEGGCREKQQYMRTA